MASSLKSLMEGAALFRKIGEVAREADCLRSAGGVLFNCDEYYINPFPNLPSARESISKTTSWIAVAAAIWSLSWRRLRDPGFDYSPVTAVRAFAKNARGVHTLVLYSPL